jgi:hypothetical protein
VSEQVATCFNLEEPLRQAEEWARREYLKVRERNGDRDAGNAGDMGNDPTVKASTLETRFGDRRTALMLKGTPWSQGICQLKR